MKSVYNIAIVGATGVVGQEFLKILAERDFPVGELRLLASERSQGKKIAYQGKEYTVEATTEQSFERIDIALFAGGEASRLYGPAAVAAGAIVIDNSSTFRFDPEVPLVVPEVNPEDVLWHKGIIANPNCSTIQLVVVLKPLHDVAKIKRIIVSTYQAVSGAGSEAIDEMLSQSREFSADPNAPVEPHVFPHQIAFNLIPHIDIFLDNDYTKEEMKIVWETRKMFHDEDIQISATAVRVPVLRCHSEAVYIETESSLTLGAVREILAGAPGVVVIDDVKANAYPMPITAFDTDEVYVGRIREDISTENGLALWIVADQVRKGAATNAIQIAELLIEKGLV